MMAYNFLSRKYYPLETIKAFRADEKIALFLQWVNLAALLPNGSLSVR